MNPNPKDEKPEDVKIVGLQFPDGKGGMTATFKHSVIPEMASQFVKLFKEEGGVNYVEWTMEDMKSPEVGQFTVSIQRRDGKTASEKASAYKAVLEKIENLEHDAECGNDQGSRTGDCMDDHRCYCASRAARKALHNI